MNSLDHLLSVYSTDDLPSRWAGVIKLQNREPKSKCFFAAQKLFLLAPPPLNGRIFLVL
jgi:hypothetical protein